MPMVRYRIRNECGLADPAVYLTAEKDDPEALLEGVAMAGLVGVLRQLGDLAEFAAEIFHDLHEEVMATASRGHGLLFRVLQLEAEFPLIEKSILSETDHSHCAHNAGIDWHANIRVEHNSVIQGDMPRFILDSYEECRSPPRLFMLDKFDVAGAGACLTRYSNPSFFKTTSTSFETMESEVQREKRARKHKKNESYWRSAETTESRFTPMLDNLQFTTTEKVPEKIPARHAKLKHRKMMISDIRCRKSYMESLFKEESFELNNPRSSSSDCHNNKITDWAPDVKDILIDGVTDSSLAGMEFSLEPPKDEMTGKVQNEKSEDGENLEIVSRSSCVTKKIYPYSQIDEEAMLVEHGNEMENHALDFSLSENDMIPPPLKLMQSNLLAVSGFLTDDDHGSSTSDDIGSELENYVDALNTMEFEIGADYESRAKADLSLFNPEFQGENLSISRHPQSSESCIVRSFNILATTEKMKDEMPILSQSVIEKSFCLEINHRENGNLERMCKDMELVPSVSLASNEVRHHQSSATIVFPVNNKEFSNYCKTDSALMSKHNVEETQSLNKHSDVATSGGTKINSKVGEHAESSFLPWLTNHVAGNPTFKECSDIFTGILEEIHSKDHTEERPSESKTVKDNMPSNLSEIGHCILPENGSAEYSKISILTSLNDEFGQPLVALERDINDCISGCSSPSVLVGSTVLESQNTSSELESDMQSEDLPTENFLNNMKGNDEEAKQLNSSVLFVAEQHMLPLALSNDDGSHGSTQTSENGNDLAYISDERGSPCGCQNKAAMDQLSGHDEKGTFNDMASTFEMLKHPQTQTGSRHVEVSSGCPKDSLPDSVEDDVGYSVENFSPKSLAFSPNIVSSILLPLSLTSEFESANVTLEESVHQQTPLGFGNVDISGNESLISSAIADELEHSSVASVTLASCNRNMLKPLLSAYQEDLIRNHLQTEVSELTMRNGNEHVRDGLEPADGSTALSVSILTENGIPKDIIDDQVLNKQNSAKVIAFDILTLDDRLSEDNTLHQHKLHIKEPVVTRDSTLLQFENKPFMLFTLNEMLEMANSVSRNQSSTPELPRLSESELVGAKMEDKTSAGKMEQDFYFKSVNTEENTDTEVLSLLQPSNVCNFVVQFHDVPVSKDVLNLNRPFIELDNAKAHSNSYSMTLDGTNYQIPNLLEFSNLCSDDAQIQRVSVSEDASLNQHKPKLEEIAITNGLTSLMLGSKLHLPHCKNEDHTSIESLIGSREDAQDSNLCASMQQCHTNSERLEVLSENASVFEAVIENDKFIERLTCSREDKEDSDPDVRIQHCQTDAERIELLFENVSEAVDETSVSPLYRAVENFEPTHIHIDKVFSLDPTIIQYNLKQEHETLLSHGCSDELNMSLSKTYKNEQLDANITVSFQIDSAHPGCSLTSEMASGSVIVGCPISTVHTHEYTQALSGEMISIFPAIEEGIEEIPQPPLPPIQWIMGKTELGSLMEGARQTIMESNMHMNLLPAANEKMIPQSAPPPSAIQKSFLTDSPFVDCKLTESFNLSEFPAITINQKQQNELYSSALSFFSSQADEKHSYVNFTTDPNNPCTIAPSLEDVPQNPNFLETVPLQPIEKSRSSLVNFLPGLELERSLEASIRDRDGIQPLSSFMLMPINGNGMYQHGYGDYEYYEGENMQYHNLLTPFPVSAHSISHYGYQIIQRNGNSSFSHDMMLPDIEVGRLNGKQRSILNRPRDLLIEAVAAHDKSTMRKVSELDQPPTKPKDDEKNLLLEQIKNKSLNLKPTTSKVNMIKAPSTNLKVAAILEKANAIRMACVGSDEEEEGDDDWNDS